MNVDELLERVNSCADDLDLVAARKYIEENRELLAENRHRLKRNARELLDFILKMQDSGNKALQRNEIAAINAINSYATKFDLRGLKVAVKNHSELILRDDVIPYFNTDAKIMLASMNAIPKS
ncbi:hypothetical protein [Paenisporosarcina cavernae]|uniref:Uncharacterized protein n=1 Tax=Paenisporosarcina cavernae TaxID=2320858 RepID=A0A385YQM7_9BACL|nr:hypothetical protein [Paenisporosarcina cavernae]AYC28886.1 hypothetical protein D3873_02990 [Paenisporosarcina cavernae]